MPVHVDICIRICNPQPTALSILHRQQKFPDFYLLIFFTDLVPSHIHISNFKNSILSDQPHLFIELIIPNIPITLTDVFISSCCLPGCVHVT